MNHIRIVKSFVNPGWEVRFLHLCWFDARTIALLIYGPAGLVV